MWLITPSNTAKSIASVQLVSDTWLELELTSSNQALLTTATLIYKRTTNLRAVQLLLGHTKLRALSAISESN